MSKRYNITLPDAVGDRLDTLATSCEMSPSQVVAQLVARFGAHFEQAFSLHTATPIGTDLHTSAHQNTPKHQSAQIDTPKHTKTPIGTPEHQSAQIDTPKHQSAHVDFAELIKQS